MADSNIEKKEQPTVGALMESIDRFLGRSKAINETNAKTYADKAFVDNKARASMQGMFKEDQWRFDANGMLRATMKSNSGGSDYKITLFPFKLADALKVIREKKTAGEEPDYGELATDVVRGDIAPFCDCPNFIYQNAGPRGENRQLLNPSGGKSKNNYGLCKHLLFPVQTFPFIQSMFAKKLKEGFFDEAAVNKQANDGRTKAFLNESAELGPVMEDGRWMILEADEFCMASLEAHRESSVNEAELNEAEKLSDDEYKKLLADFLKDLKPYAEQIEKACSDLINADNDFPAIKKKHEKVFDSLQSSTENAIIDLRYFYRNLNQNVLDAGLKTAEFIKKGS